MANGQRMWQMCFSEIMVTHPGTGGNRELNLEGSSPHSSSSSPGLLSVDSLEARGSLPQIWLCLHHHLIPPPTVEKHHPIRGDPMHSKCTWINCCFLMLESCAPYWTVKCYFAWHPLNDLRKDKLPYSEGGLVLQSRSWVPQWTLWIWG